MASDNSKFFEKKKEITSTALECFSKYGFDGTSIKTIAQEIGSKSTALIYYYFKDKDDLLFSCMTDIEVPVIHDIPDTTEPEEWLALMMADYLDLLSVPEFKKLVLCAYSVVGRRSDFLEGINMRFREPHRLRFYQFLDSQISAGNMAPLHYYSAFQEVFYPLSMGSLISGDWRDWNRNENQMNQLRIRAKHFLKGFAQ